MFKQIKSMFLFNVKFPFICYYRPMPLLDAIFLGILQGATEFLPVSSSGHLVIVQHFLPNFSQPGVLFDALLHAGTMFAILVYFRKQLLTLDRKMLTLLLVGTIPAAVVGLLFSDFVEGLFTSIRVVGLALIVTGVMNWMVDKVDKTQKSKLSIKNALVIGAFQAVALIPGISRSGSTIFGGVAQGIKRQEAAVFSFLLSVPAVAGAVFLQVVKFGVSAQLNAANYLLGMLAAFLVGYFSISILMRVLVAKRFRIFAVYCFIVGALALTLS